MRKFTEFHDCHSGGYVKTDFREMIIEAEEEEAKLIFYNRFKINPDRVSCTCCGRDFSSIEWDETEIDLEALKKDEGIFVLERENITEEDTIGEIPRQGYVWVD